MTFSVIFKSIIFFVCARIFSVMKKVYFSVRVEIKMNHEQLSWKYWKLKTSFEIFHVFIFNMEEDWNRRVSIWEDWFVGGTPTSENRGGLGCLIEALWQMRNFCVYSSVSCGCLITFCKSIMAFVTGVFSVHLQRFMSASTRTYFRPMLKFMAILFVALQLDRIELMSTGL